MSSKHNNKTSYSQESVPFFFLYKWQNWQEDQYVD